jgi:kinesin family protein 4/21/27
MSHCYCHSLTKQILKEEVHDLLDPNPAIAVKSDAANGFVTKPGTVGKPQIQIRENTNGEITLAGVSEVDVVSLQEMAACLERGSLCRSTACTNMNTRSRFVLVIILGG